MERDTVTPDADTYTSALSPWFQYVPSSAWIPGPSQYSPQNISPDRKYHNLNPIKLSALNQENYYTSSYQTISFEPGKLLHLILPNYQLWTRKITTPHPTKLSVMNQENYYTSSYQTISHEPGNILHLILPNYQPWTRKYITPHPTKLSAMNQEIYYTSSYQTISHEPGNILHLILPNCQALNQEIS